MRIFFSVQDDGSLRLTGILEPPYHGKIRSFSPEGAAVCGLSYEEALQYAWIETDDAGNFIAGEKRPPPSPGGYVEPPFLRKR